ncbi:unnamed protein product [Tilletia laevis]|uniref:Mitogen-activated protein kinase n=4 Tax=Tilletia TaxID=13289 RepID=A0A8X7MX53_9BASI|nr:hypothetical protein CF336_g2158 [Tilletia laevis]KAE8202376.1 hypothetical protein CF328_g2246 [Tilletia controversa]KAE8263460.1 hypothetical protein A4X03_0g1660 [Tilletia caries]KAE8251334.1 hypothetical protein A4X06_0g2722 [Tilletia controversa]CAD6884305.1 unnamed protein product [Tilletia caries]
MSSERQNASVPSEVAPAAAAAPSMPSPSRAAASSSVAAVLPPAAATGRNVTRTRRSRRTETARVPPEDHPLSADNLAARGYYTFQCLGVPFHVHRRYRFVRELGIGAYGCVALCRDEILDCNVAIKKVTRIFDRDVLARRALREVAILRHLGGCDNVSTLIDFDASFVDFAEVYFMLSASEADLSQIIRSGQGLSDAHLQYFMAQILRGTRYMHAANVVHRDLKPGNLLVNADCALRLCDFGLARAFTLPFDNDEEEAEDEQLHSHRPQTPEVDGAASRNHVSKQSPLRSPNQQPPSEPDSPDKPKPDRRLSLSTSRLDFPGGPLTDYVATRWYRAPEIMLCLKDGYGSEIDMWSIGCILAELMSGQPIFPGKDYVDQIARINSVLGAPSDQTIAKIGSEKARTYLLSLPKEATTSLERLYPNATPDAIDLLSKMLCWDPEERISAADALQHPWLKAYHRSNANWTPPQPFSRFADVEFIKSLPAFRAAFDLQASEIRAENERADQEAASEADSSDVSGDGGAQEASTPSSDRTMQDGRRRHRNGNGSATQAEDDDDDEGHQDQQQHEDGAAFASSSSSSSGTSAQSHLGPTSATSAGSSIATPCSSALGEDPHLLSPGMYPRRQKGNSGYHPDPFCPIDGQTAAERAAASVRRSQVSVERQRGRSQNAEAEVQSPAATADVLYGAPSEWLCIDEKVLSTHQAKKTSAAPGTEPRRRTRSHSFSQMRTSKGGFLSPFELPAAVNGRYSRSQLRSESREAQRQAIAV